MLSVIVCCLLNHFHIVLSANTSLPFMLLTTHRSTIKLWIQMIWQLSYTDTTVRLHEQPHNENISMKNFVSNHDQWYFKLQFCSTYSTLLFYWFLSPLITPEGSIWIYTAPCCRKKNCRAATISHFINKLPINYLSINL